MKDSAAKGISTARAKDKLANEGQVAARNKAGVGKRNNSSGLSSSSSSISGSTSSTTRSSSSISGTNSRNSTRRMQNQQSINNAIKFAKKIPVLRKKAQMVEKIQKIKNAKSKGFVKSFLPNYSNKKPSDAEIEAANATEQTGEEYKPEDVDSKFTVKLDKKTKILAISIVAGIMLSYIVVGIFDMLSVMDTAKEVYLASHENPTEEEFEAAYNAQAGENDRSSGTYNSNVKSDSTGNIIMVGDSRTVGLCNSVYGISVANCSTLGYKKNNNTFISLTSTAYDWFSSKALPEIKNQLKSNEKSTVFINMGTNRLDDLINQANSYAKDYNDLAKTYSKANIVAVSVTPIIDSKVAYYKDVNLDSNVVKFNNQLKSKLSSDVIYCDVYSKVKGKVDASDGVHYDTASYKLINDEMMNCIKSSASVTKTGKAAIDKMTEIALKEADEGTGPQKFKDWFGSDDEWCGMFISWLFDQVNGLDKYYVKNGFAGGGARSSIERGYGTWLEDECTDSKTVPKQGDILHYKYYPSVDKYSSEHVGYVYKVDDKYVYTVEGNYDPNHVATVKYERKSCDINGYYRPNY